MRLFLKIFFAYWVIVTAVNLLSDEIVRDQLRRPPFTRAAMRSALRLYASEAAEAYEHGGCKAVPSRSLAAGDGFYLASATGQPLCQQLDVTGLDSLAEKLGANGNVLARRFHSFQVIGMRTPSSTGRTYVVYLVSPLTPRASFFAWLMPGWTTSVASGAVTVVFTILLVLPARRLRKAASEISRGNLAARVPVPHWSMLGPNDEMRTLMVDFNRMADRLEKLVDSQRLLLRDVSHELRSPLARLGLSLELARRTKDEEVLRHLSRIERESVRLNNLIAQILSLSLMESATGDVMGSSISLEDLLREVLPDIEFEAGMRECEIVAHVSGKCVVKADPDLLHSALENVLRNAIRYSPKGGRITVDLENKQPVGVVRVCDNGPGVPSDELQAILRPFYRVDKARGEKTGGFGVGLAIADRAVRLHGGQLQVVNRAHGGLMVEISLPLEFAALPALTPV